MMTEDGRPLVLATELTIAWLANPNTRVASGEVPEFLTSAHQMITQLLTASAAPVTPPEPAYEPAVSIRKSLASPDRIISMIDGKPYMSLARHLKLHNLTPDQYRERYGLKPDYPMVAPAYSEARRAMALKIGLGGRAAAARAVAAAAAGESDAPPRSRGRGSGNKAPRGPAASANA